MSRMDFRLRTIAAYDAWRWAEELFEQRDYYGAAEVLEHLLRTSDDSHDLDQVRELLARSYYHGARLEKAAAAARDLLERRPDHSYAALLLQRSLERAGRREEAAEAKRVAQALGAG